MSSKVKCQFRGYDDNIFFSAKIKLDNITIDWNIDNITESNCEDFKVFLSKLAKKKFCVIRGVGSYDDEWSSENLL